MRRRRALGVGLSILSLHARTAQAFHSADFGIQSAAAANKFMAANPPLPMLRYPAGKFRLSLQPTFFSGRRDNPQIRGQSGNFRGYGGGIGASYAFADRWGAYAWGIGSALTGDFKNTAADFVTQVKGVRATFMTASLGVVYQALGRTDGGFSLPVFAGPTVTYARFAQTVVDGPITDPSTINVDFDMESSQVYPGVLAGMQAGIPLGKSLAINPFFIGAWAIGPECRPYRVRQLRRDVSGLSNQGSPACGEISLDIQANKRFIEFPRTTLAGGINLSYRPWGLSLNATAPFLARLLAQSENTPMSLVTATFSFGSPD